MFMKRNLILCLACLIGINTFAQITVGNTTLQEREVIGNLDIPWEIKWGYDGFIWMTERPGIVSRVNVETGEKNVILDIQNTVYSGNNEAGLLGMEFHPEFATNHILFMTYTYTQGNQIKERLSSFTYNTNSEMLENEQILLNDINGYTTHIGSRILALEDLTILISTGDAQDQPASQDVNELTGKILRMDISDDNFGNEYENGLKKENVDYFFSKKKEALPTGTCLILITPDSERTMCTFLGTAGKIDDNDINPEIIKKSEIIFLEGYLWDEGDPKKAFDKAITNANKVAMSLSDQFCVDRHKPHFLELVKNNLDITFANEDEIKSLINAKSFSEVIEFGKQINKLIIITRGEKGAVSIQGKTVVEVGTKENLKIIDLTGAGDLFAAGYLHGYLNNLSQNDCLNKGTEMSSKIIQQIGARL